MVETPEAPTIDPATLPDDIHFGLTRELYCAIPGMNYSTLKHFAKSPAHARQEMLSPSDPTKAMDFGTAVHCAVLEPGRFASSYVVPPKVDKRTNAGKALLAEFEDQNRGKGLLDADDMDTCRGILRSVYDHEFVGPLLSEASGSNEVVAAWTDQETGVRCKAMIDRVVARAGWTWVIDIKTTQDARPWAFGRVCGDLLYHLQAAFYLDGLATIAPAERRFLWIAVETKPPFGVKVYEPDFDTLQQGRIDARDFLRTYKDCQRSGNWPAYPTGVEMLRIPSYKLGGISGTV